MVAVTLDAVLVAVTGEIRRRPSWWPTASTAGPGCRPARSDGDRPNPGAGHAPGALGRTGRFGGWLRRTALHLRRPRSVARPRVEARQVSVAYLLLAQTGPVVGRRPAGWTGTDLLPWEDHRDGRPPELVGGGDRADRCRRLDRRGRRRALRSAGRRQERAQVVFGLDGTAWDGVRVLERYELLYELGLLAEADRGSGPRRFRPSARAPLDSLRRISTSTTAGWPPPPSADSGES